jgi:hypothetical protein
LTGNDQDSFWFDEVIDRREVPALKVHPMVLWQGGEDLFAAGVADMDFKAPRSCSTHCKNDSTMVCSDMKPCRTGYCPH